MADKFTLKGGDNDAKFKPHPEGQFAAQCRDFLDLGEKVSTYPGKPPKLVYKVGLVFETGEVNEEAGHPYQVQTEFTASMYETANLRQFLENWRGKSYTEEELKKGIPADRLAGQWALISIEHKTTAKGRTFANIKSISPLPKQMPRPELGEYTRAPYWDEKKKAYAEEAAKFRREAVAEAFEAMPEALIEADPDDLPF